MKNKCIVLVNSCDAYSDTWYPFFKLLKKYWPNREFPVFLNTESKKYEYEDIVKIAKEQDMSISDVTAHIQSCGFGASYEEKKN